MSPQFQNSTPFNRVVLPLAVALVLALSAIIFYLFRPMILPPPVTSPATSPSNPRRILLWRDNPPQSEFYLSEQMGQRPSPMPRDQLATPHLICAYLEKDKNQFEVFWSQNAPHKLTFEFLDAKSAVVQTFTVSDIDHAINLEYPDSIFSAVFPLPSPTPDISPNIQSIRVKDTWQTVPVPIMNH